MNKTDRGAMPYMPKEKIRNIINWFDWLIILAPLLLFYVPLRGWLVFFLILIFSRFLLRELFPREQKSLDEYEEDLEWSVYCSNPAECPRCGSSESYLDSGEGWNSDQPHYFYAQMECKKCGESWGQRTMDL